MWGCQCLRTSQEKTKSTVHYTTFCQDKFASGYLCLHGLKRRSLNTHQLGMTIRSQRCETKNGGECDNGYKNESQALYGIWEGFKTICVSDILAVCVCMFIFALLGFLYKNVAIYP